MVRLPLPGWWTRRWWGGRAHHRRRRRALPGPARQSRVHRRKWGRRRAQLAGHPIPRRSCRQHRLRARTGIHARRIDLWRQHRNIRHARLLL